MLEKCETLWYSARYKFKDMAITKNAKRGVRVSEKKRVVNDKLRRTLKEAVKEAYSRACPGDIILFSPGFASFGMFKNEYDKKKLTVGIKEKRNPRRNQTDSTRYECP